VYVCREKGVRAPIAEQIRLKSKKNWRVRVIHRQSKQRNADMWPFGEWGCRLVMRHPEDRASTEKQGGRQTTAVSKPPQPTIRAAVLAVCRNWIKL
jgi:hypothetical protein